MGFGCDERGTLSRTPLCAVAAAAGPPEVCTCSWRRSAVSMCAICSPIRFISRALSIWLFPNALKGRTSDRLVPLLRAAPLAFFLSMIQTSVQLLRGAL